MIPGFREFKNLLNGKKIKMKNPNFEKTLQKFDLLEVTEDEINDEPILEYIHKSEVIAIDLYQLKNISYFIICIKSHVIIIHQSKQVIINEFYSPNNKDKLFFAPNKSNLIQNADNSDQLTEYENKQFIDEFYSFKENFQIDYKSDESIKKFWYIIEPCIITYLIKQSYLESNKDRINEFIKKLYNENDIKEYKENEFIKLRTISITDSSIINLNYHIESEKLFVIKSFKNDDKLNEREINNYKKIRYPFIPKYYGKIKNNSIVIEFINGQTLYNLKKNELNFEQKIEIVIEILNTFLYLHSKNFIYRDLKPNNLILDKNNRIVLIDFDQMINIKEREEDLNILFTRDFASDFVDPKINEEGYTPSFKNDIYSIGKIISLIFKENLNSHKQKIDKIVLNCTNNNLNKRPSLTEIIKDFEKLEKNISLINIVSESVINQNDSEALNNFGNIYYDGKYIKKDINKSIYYFTLAANQNNPDAQNSLGIIYYDGIYINPEINKSIYYLTLAANQNRPDAQYNLGRIYYEGEYITPDIKKSIYYLTLAANQNDPDAQYFLGYIYYDAEYVSRDIDKSIYYLTLAAKQNHPEAQNRLGYIYSEAEYITRDINKSIYYLTLAADQNNQYAQYNLGHLYYEGKYITRNINKSIHYLTLAADQNNSEAQHDLGIIYLEGKYIKQDIEKSIHYFTLAANQNDSNAQYYLSIIYIEGKYIKQDIKKAINYLVMSASLNERDSQYTLGMSYLSGKNFTKSINKATYYLYLASEQGQHDAQFVLGVIYSKGEYVKQDIPKAIGYYKEASSFNHSHAKNNLAMIYKNGLGTTKNLRYATELLQEAVKLNNIVSMYNLSNLYFYFYESNNENKKLIINMLINSLDSFPMLFGFFCIVLIKNHQAFTIDAIEKVIESYTSISKEKMHQISNEAFKYIKNNNLEKSSILEKLYQLFKRFDLSYDLSLDFSANYYLNIVITYSMICIKENENETENQNRRNIDKYFYEGFGIDITN